MDEDDGVGWKNQTPPTGKICVDCQVVLPLAGKECLGLTPPQSSRPLEKALKKGMVGRGAGRTSRSRARLPTFPINHGKRGQKIHQTRAHDLQVSTTNYQWCQWHINGQNHVRQLTPRRKAEKTNRPPPTRAKPKINTQHTRE